ncbi:MAG: DUF2076 domain-containing protein [Acidibrevibacterium sp.]|jgi:hypothetical protein|uniref:DUF2076 domain-containing protein n=1 Tax=Acidibrevibacterium fodinaquatile TaxID=1969806 RepID=UPI000E0DEECE|nr:DUF2076 domain-containing protein [Acidibrevibacterium fodinaquatile]MCA7120097.1 DUF2076 domain-containing protein [Acidibrevibacterium fodinaquatile]
MTNEERDIISRFIARIAGAESSGFAGSVPATASALPPIDPEADALIAELFTRYPAARYRITQTAFVQEHALAEAQNRIRQLQADLEQARGQAQAAAAPSRPSGFFGGMFGGGQAQAPGPQPAYAPPPPQYPPNYQPGMFQRQGSGFLGSALTTAAGVAGGMVVGNALMDLLSPRHAEAGGFGMMEPTASPWSAGPMGAPGATPEAANPWNSVANQPEPSAGWDAAQNDASFDAVNDAADVPDDTSFDDTSFDDI